MASGAEAQVRASASGDADTLVFGCGGRSCRGRRLFTLAMCASEGCARAGLRAPRRVRAPFLLAGHVRQMGIAVTRRARCAVCVLVWPVLARSAKALTRVSLPPDLRPTTRHLNQALLLCRPPRLLGSDALLLMAVAILLFGLARPSQ